MNSGISETSLQLLHTSFQESVEDYALYEKGGYIYVERFFDLNDMAQGELLKLKEALIQLINLTKPLIERCLSS